MNKLNLRSPGGGGENLAASASWRDPAHTKTEPRRGRKNLVAAVAMVRLESAANDPATGETKKKRVFLQKVFDVCWVSYYN